MAVCFLMFLALFHPSTPTHFYLETLLFIYCFTSIIPILLNTDFTSRNIFPVWALPGKEAWWPDCTCCFRSYHGPLVLMGH